MIWLLKINFLKDEKNIKKPCRWNRFIRWLTIGTSAKASHFSCEVLAEIGVGYLKENLDREVDGLDENNYGK